MEFIKNKEKCINSVNELIDNYGEPKELAKCLDDLFFDWLLYFGAGNEYSGKWFYNRVSNIKAIRDFLSQIETSQAMNNI